MTVFNRSNEMQVAGGTQSSPSRLHNTLPGRMQLPPVTFYNATQGQRDTLILEPGLTLLNATAGELQTFMYDRWAPHVLQSAPAAAGDALTYDPLIGLWVPTPTNRPLVNQLRVYGNLENTVEVSRIYVVPVKTGTGTGDLQPVGIHTLASTLTYRITIDSAGTQSWDTATFRWKNSTFAGPPYGGEAVPIATGAVSGRKVLAPILLDFNIGLLFTEGTYVNGDQWDITVIGTNSQSRSLVVDLVNQLVQVQRLVLSDDSIGAAETVFEDFNASGYGELLSEAGITFRWYRTGFGGPKFQFAGAPVQVANSYIELDEIATPGTPGSDTGRFYVGATASSFTEPRYKEDSQAEEMAVSLTRTPLHAIPPPLGAHSNALVAIAMPNNNTVAQVGLITLPIPMTVVSFSFNSTVAAVGVGELRICLYKGDGTRIPTCDVSTAAVTLGVNTVALGNPTYLPAGNYFILVGNATAWATTQPTLQFWTENTTFNVGSYIVNGTVVMTAGAAPSPLGTITTQISARTLYCRFNSA